MLQKNPEVQKIVGVDLSEKAIVHAKRHFGTDKTEFICSNITDFSYSTPFDIAVCLETIEHLQNPEELVDMFNRTHTESVILSYPSKKSTHYNPFHIHDFELDDITRLFLPKYVIYDTYEYFREFIFVFLKKT